MLIRLGYVSIAKCLSITSSSSYTFSCFSKDKNYDKLDDVIKSNFRDLKEIIIYNIKNNIHFYRLTSKLIPLATHSEVTFSYISKYKDYYDNIGNLINNHNIRIDSHPDQFAVLNSTKKSVVDNTINILKYHYDVLNAFNIKNPIIILHVGSSEFGKQKSITRFINNFNKLPLYIKKSIALENDDKIFNINDVLLICEKLNIPMVLDYHHHLCNNNNININNYLERIFLTWKSINPKVHFSSPKNNTKKDFRSHSNYIDSTKFIEFLSIIKDYNYNIDIMLEVKEKDEALFRLIRELKYKTDYKFIDETSFII